MSKFGFVQGQNTTEKKKQKPALNFLFTKGTKVLDDWFVSCLMASICLESLCRALKTEP